MQWTIIMSLPFYDFQNILEHYSQILEERKKEEDEEMKKNGYDEKDYSPEKMMSRAKKNMPKMPSFTMPKF